ncbi:hypothetical protein Plec18170_003227 [Paecilomyces lecythidis]
MDNLLSGLFPSTAAGAGLRGPAPPDMLEKVTERIAEECSPLSTGECHDCSPGRGIPGYSFVPVGRAVLTRKDSKLITLPTRPSAPPMTMVIAGLTAFLAENPHWIPSRSLNAVYHKNEARIDQAIIDSVAAFSVAVAIADAHSRGAPFRPASTQRSFYENLFTMMGRVDTSTGQPDRAKLSLFRRWGNAILDHGNTNSTFALRVTASSLTDPLSGLIGALTAGCGLLHFGAQESAYRTMEAVRSPDRVPALLETAKKGHVRLYGVGHRSYKGVDPRIAPVRQLLDEISISQGNKPIPYLDVAEEIDRLTGQDEYFIKRRLRPNADLYGQFFYVALYVSATFMKSLLLLPLYFHKPPTLTN